MNKARLIQDIFFVIMRLTLTQFLLLAFFASMVSAADLKGQGILDREISVEAHDKKIKSILNEIEKQTSIIFTYRPNLIPTSKKVSIKIEGAALREVLTRLLGPDIQFLAQGDEILLKPADPGFHAAPLPGFAPPSLVFEVSGKVADEAGQPLPGVNVIEKGTTSGTVTDADGNYHLSVQDGNATLIFTFIGYQKQEIPVNGRAQIDLALDPDVRSLEEVVVVGYGTVKKSDLTGSVSKIGAAEIESVPVPRVDQALQGKAAGVQVTSISGAPGAGSTIRIRGGNSISASNEPLYVIDGFVGAGDLNSINAADIESIEILKDASATAIYGARGANGVILITTKSGKAGKPVIAVNVYSGVQQLPGEIDLLTGPQLADYVNERAALFGTSPVYPDLSKVTHTDWQDAITDDAGIQNANISFSGGSEKLSYYLSGNYFDQDGIILNSGFERYQTRLKLDLKITDWLSVGTNINFSRSDKSNNKADLYNVLKEAPTSLPVFDAEGNYVILSPLSGQLFENPVASAKLTLDNTYDNSLLGNWYAQASFKNGLRFRATLGVDNGNSTTNTYLPGALPLRNEQKKGGFASISGNRSLNLLNENTISYSRESGKHHFDVLGGFTYQHETVESYSASGEGFTNDILAYHNLATGNPLLAKIGSDFREWTILSFLGRVNYSFNGKYLFTASARRDGSSRLSENYKYAFFPSAAFAWKLGEEDFIKDLGWFSDLKVRASYGKTGNQAIDIYSTLASLNVANAYFNDTKVVGYNQGNLPNDNLKWETTDQYDGGIEAGLLQGRLSMEFDVYYKRTHDLLLTAQIPGTTGYATRLSNIGEVENKGIEFMLNGTLLDKENISWDIAFNIAANRNKVLDLGDGLEYRDVADGARLIVGYPAAVFYGAVYEHPFKSQAEIDANPGYQAGAKPGDAKFKDVNGNGKFDGLGDYDIIGSPEPKFFGGFNSSVTLGRFSLSAFFNYSYGNDVINSLGPRWFVGDYASNVSKVALERWTPENNDSDIPGAGAAGKINVNSQAWSFAVQDGSFLRLRTVQLGYRLPLESVSWIQDASIYFTGSNLFLVDDYTWGYDPEVNQQGTNSVLRGFDGTSYPQNRSYIVGLNVRF